MSSAFLEDLHRAASQDQASARRCADRLLGDGLSSLFLVEEALRRAGTSAQRTRLDGYLASPPWCARVRLDLQEYRAVLPVDVGFDRPIRSALSTSGFGDRHGRSLAGRVPVAAARALLADLAGVVQQACGVVTATHRLRTHVAAGRHLLRALALGRLTAAVGRVRGRRVLEIGCEDDALLTFLAQRGAEVWGVDLAACSHPRVARGDFMTATLPGPFDVVVATAVFEAGSGFTHLPRAGEEEVPFLHRLRDLLAPGGVVVVENVGLPVPFSREVALRHGLVADDPRTPVQSVWADARGCTLRRADPIPPPRRS
jgi:hypothetical protein